MGRSVRDAPLFCKSLRRVASRGLADTVDALCNSVAINFCYRNLADTLALLGMTTGVGSMGSGGFSCFTVILNAVKNLSERGDDGAIVDGCTIPEILRFTQDDKGYSKEAGE